MRTLAIDCVTEACSVALFDDGQLLGHDYRILGRGHAELLVPMIAALPDKGKAERIVVALGPGSFTGVRVGLAAAKALALAWDSELRGYCSLTLIAAMSRTKWPDQRMAVVTTGGHGEWFVRRFDAGGLPTSDVMSLPLAQAAALLDETHVAGSQAEALVALRGFGQTLALLPDARQVAGLSNADLALTVAPRYGRPPDARLPEPAK